MRIHNLYTDDKGESHFRDIEVDWAEERRGSRLYRDRWYTDLFYREMTALRFRRG